MAETPPGDREASIWEHVQELAIRLRRILVAIAVAAGVLSVLPARLEGGLLGYRPLAAELPKLIFRHIVPPEIEAFDGKIYRVIPFSNDAFESVSVLAQAIFLLGFIGASPIIAKEIWEYVEPALYPHEKEFAKRYIALFLAAFIIGVFFGIYIVAPMIELMVLKLYPLYIPEEYKTGWSPFSPASAAGNGTLALYIVLVPFGVVAAKLLPVPLPAAENLAEYAAIPLRVSVGEVVSFALKLGLAFGLLFEIPIVIYLLLSRGILDPEMFSSETMKYIFLGTIVLGAIISPDPSGIGMMMIGLSLYAPLHVAVYLGKKRALEKKLVEEAAAEVPRQP